MSPTNKAAKSAKNAKGTPTFSPGDRVIADGEGPGGIVKIVKGSADVRFDSSGEEMSIPLWQLRPETAEDRARRKHEEALDAWYTRRPSTKHTRICISRHQGKTVIDGVQAPLLRDPDEIRKGAAELLELANWLAEKPASP